MSAWLPDNAGPSGTNSLRSRTGYAISLTLRGYEPSSILADSDYSMEAVAEDVLALIRGLGTAPCTSLGMMGAAMPTTLRQRHRSAFGV